LTQKMDEAVKLGYVPMTEAAKTATMAVKDSGDAAEAAAKQFDALRDAAQSARFAQAQQEHAAAVATMTQLTAQPSGPAVHAYAPIESPSNVPKAIYYERAAYELGREEAFTKEWARASYQHGGLVPGV